MIPTGSINDPVRRVLTAELDRDFSVHSGSKNSDTDNAVTIRRAVPGHVSSRSGRAIASLDYEGICDPQ